MPRLVEAILDICLQPVSKTDRRTYLECLAQDHPKVFAGLIGKLLTAAEGTATGTEIVCMFPDLPPERRAAVPRDVDRPPGTPVTSLAPPCRSGSVHGGDAWGGVKPGGHRGDGQGGSQARS